MDLRRFLDLYISESGEHVRLLQRSLLALERDDAGGDAVAEAFRAAHTLKGISAAMGYRAVADMAHQLEDRLDALRAGTLAADGGLIDRLLADADALASAVADAVRTAPLQHPADELVSAAADAAGTAPLQHPAEEPAAPAAAAPDGEPAGTAVIALVRLQPDAPIKAARALLVLRGLAAQPGLLGSDPAEFADDFAGEFRAFFAAGADAAAIEAAILRAGEVASVEFVEAGAARGGGRQVRQESAAAGPAPASALPARQIRVDAVRLDAIADGIGELSVLLGRLPDDAPASGAQGEMTHRIGAVLMQLQEDVLQLRMVPVRDALDRLPRVVRDAARTLGRDVELVVSGDDVQLDRTIIEEIGEPLVHLVRNAVDHGIEPPAERQRAGKPARGRITITAERERSSVCITISDDGRGVQSARVAAKAAAAGLLPDHGASELTSEELFRLLSHPGLSTADRVSAVSGRGVGMDVVVSRIRALGGAIDMQSVAGEGTTFTMRLPITLALAQALRVRVGGEDYAIPLTHLAEVVELGSNVHDGGATVQLRGEQVLLVRLRSVLGVEGAGPEDTAVVAELGGRRAALAVDELVGGEQIVVKSFDPVAGLLPYFSGATLLADGRPALVLDPLSVF
jgi:two-component system, chemotaxis family, sensor kinase CheA